MNSFKTYIIHTLTLSLLVMCSLTFAQRKYEHIVPTQQITLEQGDSLIKFSIDLTDEHIHVQETKMYHWYHYHKLQITQGEYHGKALEGEYLVLSKEKQLKNKGHFHKGLKEGDWYHWRDNGRLTAIYTWHQGMKEGFSKLFNQEGKLEKTVHYHKNQIHGRTVVHVDDTTTVVQHYKHGLPTDKDPMESVVVEKEKKESFLKKLFTSKKEKKARVEKTKEKKPKKNKEDKTKKVLKAPKKLKEEKVKKTKPKKEKKSSATIKSKQ